ncbi:MAG: arginine--tRNA ligase [Alphaproteobacteria bacterium]|nr:arginine--tRNA ligase [Alphaproteobacteria bacterium]OJV14244.1 MAG: arginine--tRNA ligase [Alphaproteobacteria bacterium 33-17]
MNIYGIFKNDLDQIANKLKNENILTHEAFAVERPKDAKFGDLSTNIAIVSAKQNGTNPRALSEKYVEHIKALEYVESVSVEGAGFINVFLKTSSLHKILETILTLGNEYGSSNIGNNEKINVEYVSANPTGPMHIGHARGACFGDTLVNVLKKAGYDVTKEYYVNDAGKQIDVLAESAYYRYLEALGESVTIPEGCYPGDYLIQTGKKLAEKYGNSLKTMENPIQEIRFFVVDNMLELIKDDLARLAIKHDIFVSEYELQKTGYIEKGINLLEEKGLVYYGTLEKPKGMAVEDWEEKEQLIFKSTAFGDDMDRVVKKSDGTYAYFAGDIGYTVHKLERGYTKLVYVLGADHAGYVKRLKSIVSALSDNKVECDVRICQLVNFLNGGEVVKMSKRAGTFVTVGDVIDEVGGDVVRLMMLTRKNDITINFDLKVAKEQSKDNPVFYIQYAHARCKSVLRQAKNDSPDAYNLYLNKDFSVLNNLESQEDMEIIKTLMLFPRILEQASIHNEPHRVVFYAEELANSLHTFWAKGRDNENLKFIQKNNSQLTAARLIMIDCIANVIASCLEVCNVLPVEEM